MLTDDELKKSKKSRILLFLCMIYIFIRLLFSVYFNPSSISYPVAGVFGLPKNDVASLYIGVALYLYIVIVIGFAVYNCSLFIITFRSRQGVPEQGGGVFGNLYLLIKHVFIRCADPVVELYRRRAVVSWSVLIASIALWIVVTERAGV